MKDEQVLMVINNVPLDLMCDMIRWLTEEWMIENRPGYKGFIRNVAHGYEFFIEKETTKEQQQTK